MPDRLGPAAQTCPGTAPAAAGQRASAPRPVAPRHAALSTRKWNGYDGLRSATTLPAGRIRPDPVAGSPTRTHRSHVRLGRLRESGRGGDCSESTSAAPPPKPKYVLPTSMRFKNHFKQNLSLFKRFVGPATVISKAGSIRNHLWSSSVMRLYEFVILLRVLEPSRRTLRRQ